MRLLLAEDEKALSDALVAILKHANYTVDAVYDGEDALDYLDTDVYDGVILDIMMPKRDGISVLREARKRGMTLPILLLTAKSEIDDKVLGLDAGADDYLTKPFSMKELLARVRVMTRRKAESGDNLLSFGDLRLDTATFELGCGDKTIRLANKEFQMMQMLMSSPGQIISTEKFMDKIWGWDSETELNVVWVYISYLRKKLLNVGTTVKIAAVRGSGYTLEKTV